MKATKALLVAVAFTYALAACDSSDPPPPVETCRLTTISTPSETNLNVTYSTDGEFASWSGGTTRITWLYTSGGFVQEIYSNDELSSSARVDVNSEGMPVTVTRDFYSGGAVSSTMVFTFEYNGQNQLLKMIQQIDEDTPTTTVYTWENGNMVRGSGDSGDVIESEYYSDQKYRVGDWNWFSQTQAFGAAVVRNKNLVKSNNTASDINNYNYELDEKGNIIKMHIVRSGDPDVLTYSFQYSCP